MSESYTLPKTEYEPKQLVTEAEAVQPEKVLSLEFFMGKLFRKHE